MAPTWPETMLTTVRTDRGRPGPHPRDRDLGSRTATPPREELETFIKRRAGMTQGWTGSFDKLESLLAERDNSGA